MILYVLPRYVSYLEFQNHPESHHHYHLHHPVYGWQLLQVCASSLIQAPPQFFQVIWWSQNISLKWKSKVFERTLTHAIGYNSWSMSAVLGWIISPLSNSYMHNPLHMYMYYIVVLSLKYLFEWLHVKRAQMYTTDITFVVLLLLLASSFQFYGYMT